MSSLSIKSHNRSITSCTCFMHFPCLNKWAIISRHNWKLNSLFGFREQMSARGLTPSSQKPTVQGLPLRRKRKLPLFKMKGAQVPSFPLQHTLQECSVSAKRYIVRVISMEKKRHQTWRFFTVASTGPKILRGLAERVALPFVTTAIVHTDCVVFGVRRGRTVAAVA